MDRWKLGDPVYHPREAVLLSRAAILTEGSDVFRSRHDDSAKLEVRIARVGDLDWEGENALRFSGSGISWEMTWRGVGPYTLVMASSGIEREAIESIAVSIPVVGDRDAFSPPADQPLATEIPAATFRRWLHSDDSGQLSLQHQHDRSGDLYSTEASFVVPERELAYLAVVDSRINPLSGMALAVPGAALLHHAPVATVVGEYPDGRSQAMWVQRGRFWHYMLTRPLRDLIPRALEIQEEMK